MKAVLLTQYFPPEMGAAQNRLYALAKAFQKRGHEITVLTAFPNYPTGKIPRRYNCHYKAIEELDGIRVIRSWLHVHKSRNTIHSVLSYLSFAMSALDAGKREIKTADLLLWEYPPLSLGLTALKLAKKWNARLVTNVADLWIEAIREQKIINLPLFLDWMKKYEKKLFAESAVILGQTEGVLEGIRRQTPGKEPILWPNGANPRQFTPRDKSPFFQNKYRTHNRFVIGYAGLHGRNHNLHALLETAEILKKEPDIKFIFCGDGFDKQQLVEYARERNLKNADFYDPVPHSRLPEILSVFDIGIVIHKNLPGMRVVRSAKLFELMSMQIPVLHCPASEGGEIVRQAEAGLVLPDCDPRRIAEALLQMKSSGNLKTWGENGRKQILDNFDREKISLSIVEKLENLAGAGQISNLTQ